MSAIERYQRQTAALVRPSRRALRAEARLAEERDLELMNVRRLAELGVQQGRAIAGVSMRVMESQAMVTMTERRIVESVEPGAINAISYLANKVTINLGRVIDDTSDRVLER